MSMETAKKAINISEKYDENIVVGGGEPTLHPQLFEILGYISFVHSVIPFMIINGTCSREVFDTLLKAQNNNKILFHVSRSPWHNTNLLTDYIFGYCEEHPNMWWGNDLSRVIVPKGRAKNNIDNLIKDCENYGIENTMIVDDCPVVRIDPYGKVWADLKKENICYGSLTEDSFCEANNIVQEEENVY